MKIKVTRKALDNKGYKASDSKGSFYFNGKLVATARYDRAGFYVFFDVNGNTVGKIKSKELSLPRDRAKAWEKLGVTFGDYMEPGETPASVSKEEKSSDELRKRSLKVSTKTGDGAFDDVEDIWEQLIDGGYFTEEELQLITSINGYNVETLNDCIYARFGYRDLAQMLGEDED